MKHTPLNYYERLRYLPAIAKVVAVVFVLIGLFLFTLYLSGEWLPGYDLHIVLLGVCKSKSEIKIEPVVATNTKPIYICGKAEGTTFLNTGFLLFRNNSLIYRERTRLEPGEFYIELPLSDVTLNSDKYRIEATSGRLIIAQTSFEISKP